MRVVSAGFHSSKIITRRGWYAHQPLSPKYSEQKPKHATQEDIYITQHTDSGARADTAMQAGVVPTET